MDFIVKNHGTILAAIGTLCSAGNRYYFYGESATQRKRVKAELMNVVSHVQN